MVIKMAKRKYWIQKSIKHKGALRRWAEEKGFINKPGTINLREAYSYAKKHGLTHRMRQINLARNLRKLSKKKKKR